VLDAYPCGSEAHVDDPHTLGYTRLAHGVHTAHFTFVARHGSGLGLKQGGDAAHGAARTMSRRPRELVLRASQQALEWRFMAIQEGAAAPPFDLESDAGERVRLADFAGRWLIVYFYPKDNTPGCTREAKEFTEAIQSIERTGAAVVGVSRDSVASHCRFRDKEAIRFPLLSDPDLAAHRAYGAWGSKTSYGKTTEGVIRSTFLVAPNGKVARTWTGVKVDGHVDKVLGALSELKKSGAL
jgi:peroxiredoxin Q/BCP